MLVPEIVVLCGPPGCGKSSYAAEKPNHYAVSSDAFVELAARDQGKRYEEVWQETIKDADRKAKNTFKAYLQANVNVVFDATNMGERKRRAILQAVPGHYFKKVVVWELPQEELLRRANKRALEGGKQVPWNVVEDMLNRYTRPTLDEGWDAIEVRVK